MSSETAESPSHPVNTQPTSSASASPLWGWSLLAAVAFLSLNLSKLIEIGGKHPLESAVIAIIIGIIIGNSVKLPQALASGIKLFEKPLILGIVLLGAKLDAERLLAGSFELFLIVLSTMAVAFVASVALARLFKLERKLGVLLALGTTICGGTAVAVSAPIIRAKQEETSYAIGVIALWGIIGMLAYPFVARLLGIDDYSFGVFAGTAVHSTPQVVGAGFIYSESAGNTATAVKLIRNCFLAPAVFLLSILWKDETAKGKGVKKAMPWFLFGFFVMAYFNSAGYFSAEGSKSFGELGKFLVLMGMVGVGANTKLNSFSALGVKPMVVGFLAALAAALTSAAMISTVL